MTDWFVTLDKEESLDTAAKTLRDRGIGLLLVTDGDELVGVLSERDIVTAFADDDRLSHTALADRAKGDILTIESTAPIQDGIKKMVAGGTRHLVVVDSTGRPVGVLSARDVLSELSV
ncbi:CBS domain-containing protein [Euzebya tangerina]|uniref:CBS domain-containing protein n=1 Tax=Euzebya tangerina TaxID=591198 RepID=UPI0013C2D030|nr:CBS domain-containing protein [Euzebya tangerina]